MLNLRQETAKASIKMGRLRRRIISHEEREGERDAHGETQQRREGDSEPGTYREAGWAAGIGRASSSVSNSSSMQFSAGGASSCGRRRGRDTLVCGGDGSRGDQQQNLMATAPVRRPCTGACPGSELTESVNSSSYSSSSLPAAPVAAAASCAADTGRRAADSARRGGGRTRDRSPHPLPARRLPRDLGGAPLRRGRSGAARAHSCCGAGATGGSAGLESAGAAAFAVEHGIVVLRVGVARRRRVVVLMAVAERGKRRPKSGGPAHSNRCLD